MYNKTYVLLDDVIAHIASCDRSDILPVDCGAIKLVQNVPAADVIEVRHGRWINTGSGQECSICEEIQYGYDTGRHYCPNCGAKMDLEDADDD